MQPISWEVLAVLVIFNVPAFVLIWLVFFDDWAEYKRCMYYSWTPMYIDYLKDELTENFEHNFKLSIFHAICVVVVGLEYYLIAARAPDIIERVGSLV